MIFYKKVKRLLGVFYGGQGFRDEWRPLTEWYDEDDPAFETESARMRMEYDYFHSYELEEKYVKIENRG